MIPGPGGQSIFINPATGQPQLVNAGLLQQQQLTQLQMQQVAMNAQSLGLGNMGQVGNQNLSGNQQQQRKTLFTPYLPQANLPALLGNGQLVSGILRVNKKNRSDAYVSTQDGLLDADIFICGSKDRNRALEGDLVAVELLDVDEVWGQKREKEEKKKRKDISDTRGGPSAGSSSNTADTGTNSEGVPEQVGGMKRRGSLRQRPTQKKNDDVEVEGQSLLLVEEEEVSDEQKPLFAGHIVAVIERVAGQMFSGYVSPSLDDACSLDLCSRRLFLVLSVCYDQAAKPQKRNRRQNVQPVKVIPEDRLSQNDHKINPRLFGSSQRIKEFL